MSQLPVRGAPSIQLQSPLATPDALRERLRKAAHQFEGVFIAQLFKEMRATVPNERGEAGTEMFNALLDDAMANRAAERSNRGLGEALFRELAARFKDVKPVETEGIHGGGHS